MPNYEKGGADMPDKFTFEVSSIEDLITAAGIVEDNEVITISGKQLKEFAVGCNSIQKELNVCHQILSKIGIPESKAGLNGIKQRLENLYAKLQANQQ